MTEPPPSAALGASHGWIRWLVANRSSARLAFILRLFSMAVNSIMGFGGTPLLTTVLADRMYGTYASFQSALRLAGLGDFGIASAVSFRTGQMIGRGETDRLRPFLASARTVLLFLAVVLTVLFCALSPFLPAWMRFERFATGG